MRPIIRKSSFPICKYQRQSIAVLPSHLIREYLGLSSDWVILFGQFSQIISHYLLMFAQISNKLDFVIVIVFGYSLVCWLVPFLMDIGG